MDLKRKDTIIGTPRYLSLSAHKCYEQSRRDDLESIGYLLIYLLRDGYLPWMRAEGQVEGKNKQRESELKIKEETTIEQLTEGLPTCILTYMRYCRNLEFK